MREPDAAFADPRQAVLYDVFDDDRTDLDAYVAIAGEVGAHQVIDVGCGTGSLAVQLASAGLSVMGVDPAGASLKVARAKPNADLVTWVHGDATRLLDHGPAADLAGNVAQVFVSDEDWFDTIDSVRAALRPGGWFAFETRRPEVRGLGELEHRANPRHPARRTRCGRLTHRHRGGAPARHLPSLDHHRPRDLPLNLHTPVPRP